MASVPDDVLWSAICEERLKVTVGTPKEENLRKPSRFRLRAFPDKSTCEDGKVIQRVRLRANQPSVARVLDKKDEKEAAINARILASIVSVAEAKAAKAKAVAEEKAAADKAVVEAKAAEAKAVVKAKADEEAKAYKEALESFETLEHNERLLSSGAKFLRTRRREAQIRASLPELFALVRAPPEKATYEFFMNRSKDIFRSMAFTLGDSVKLDTYSVVAFAYCYYLVTE